MKPSLEATPGFIANERFASRQNEGRILSLSLWRDEKALIRWRTLEVHHKAQEAGRSAIFSDYHLRVGEVIADTEAPEGERQEALRRDETEVGAAKVVTISECTQRDGGMKAGAALAAAVGLPPDGTLGLAGHEVFESITNPGKLLLLASWKDEAAAHAWEPGPLPRSAFSHRLVRIIRDYGMFDRREAPQYYPPVARDDRRV